MQPSINKNSEKIVNNLEKNKSSFAYSTGKLGLNKGGASGKILRNEGNLYLTSYRYQFINFAHTEKHYYQLARQYLIFLISFI